MVKRVGYLMPRIANQENLKEAFLRAAKGRSGKRAVVNFRSRLDENIGDMHRRLLDGSFRFGRYQFFLIHDPKERRICAASFPERVAFHAMMRICHPVFDNYQVADSYASRIGRGTYKALGRAQQFVRRYEWFAKLDVKDFFNSIDHDVLLRQLMRLFKDRQLLTYFRDLIDSYDGGNGRGVPIGNLTSQYFSNHYLAVADHYLKEQIRVPAMVRYMDDTLIFGQDYHQVMEWVGAYRSFLSEHLHLELHTPIVNRCRMGVPFLGYVERREGMRLTARSQRRFQRKMAALSSELDAGEISEEKYVQRAECLHSFIDKAHTAGFLRRMAHIKGVYPQGL